MGLPEVESDSALHKDVPGFFVDADAGGEERPHVANLPGRVQIVGGAGRRRHAWLAGWIERTGVVPLPWVVVSEVGAMVARVHLLPLGSTAPLS